MTLPSRRPTTDDRRLPTAFLHRQDAKDAKTRQGIYCFLNHHDTKSAKARWSLKAVRFTFYLLRFMLVVSLLLLAAGCGGESATPTVTLVPLQPTATQQSAALSPTPNTQNPTPAQPTPSRATPAANEFQNPVLRSDFADPDVIKVGDTYYGYATNTSGHNVETASSTDLVSWKMLGDAMPSLASWAKLGGSYVWAPDVIQIGDKYVLYYTARDQKADKQCIGVATATKPEGHFKDTNDHALICPAEEGGAIDPHAMKDGDNLYLYWKNDGNCCGIHTNLYAQPLSPDGLTLTGPPTKLVTNDQVWEGSVIEAPFMWKHGDSYYLFFSANDYATQKYAVGYATCKSPTGPCEEAPENPILKSLLQKPPVIGPGGESLIQVGDQTWMVYHAWEVTGGGTLTDRRLMWLDRVDWQDGKPVVKGPTTGPQMKP